MKISVSDLHDLSTVILHYSLQIHGLPRSYFNGTDYLSSQAFSSRKHWEDNSFVWENNQFHKPLISISFCKVWCKQDYLFTEKPTLGFHVFPYIFHIVVMLMGHWMKMCSQCNILNNCNYSLQLKAPRYKSSFSTLRIPDVTEEDDGIFSIMYVNGVTFDILELEVTGERTCIYYIYIKTSAVSFMRSQWGFSQQYDPICCQLL